MTTELYVWIALVIGVACLIGGVVMAVKEADDTGDLALLTILVVSSAGMAGGLWPLTLLVGAVVGGALLLRNGMEKRSERQREADRTPAPETDAAKYRRMAREQRDLASTHRPNAPDLADLHESTAVQYDGLADLYADKP